MNIYYYVLFSVIILTLLSMPINLMAKKKININSRGVYNINKNVETFFLLVFFLQLCLIIIFRDNIIGADTKNYTSRFYYIGESNWKDISGIADYYSFEYGFTYLCKFLYCIWPDSRILLIFMGVITIFFFYVYIKTYAINPMFSALVFVCWGFWGSSMNIAREMMILPILGWSYKFIKKRQLINFLIIVFIASTLHTGAILYLPLYPLYHLKVNKDLVIISSGIAATLFIGGYKILGFLLSWTSFGWYFEKEKSTSGGNTLFVLIAVLLLCLYLKKEIIQFDENINFWMICIILGVFSTCVGMQVGIFERVAKFYLMVLMFVYPDIVYGLHKKGIYHIPDFGLIILLSYYFLRVLMSSPSSSGGIIPYISCF